jgi:hypothetical protein
MAQEPPEFAVSSNGDRWFLERDQATGEDIVIHRANPASGGTETRMAVSSFLHVTGDRPEGRALREALREMNSRDAQSESETLVGESRPRNRSPWSKPVDGAGL